MHGIDQAGLDLHHSAEVRYTIEDAQVQIMDDKSVEEVTRRGRCSLYMASHPGVRLVRGSVMGRITFTVKVANPASAKTQLSKLGGFSVQDNPDSSSVSLSDGSNQPIVELLSEFNSQPTVAAPPGPHPQGGSPVPQATVELLPRTLTRHTPPAEAASAPPHIFVQQDQHDVTDAGWQIVQQLEAAYPGAHVEPVIERVDSTKMPSVAQVRFSNPSDAAMAKTTLDVLQKTYPDARTARLGLPSPQGQLEIWLPRAK